MSRSTRAATAQQTLDILERGNYQAPSGNIVSIAKAQQACEAGTVYYDVPDHAAVLASVQQQLAEHSTTTTFEVVNQTTFAGVQGLLANGHSNIGCLNFASAKNPGGGFLGGSQAQEEALSRASGLYPTLNKYFELYELNRKVKTCLYTHRMIYSPAVPVFRNDADELLESAYTTGIVTSAAVNAGVVRQRESGSEEKIAEVMLERIERVLALFHHHGHRDIVLGAWGCGVFRNAPADMAKLFAEHLRDGRYANAFETVRFSVLDRHGGRFIEPYQEVFG